jgi:hypothetical protein
VNEQQRTFTARDPGRVFVACDAPRKQPQFFRKGCHWSRSYSWDFSGVKEFTAEGETSIASAVYTVVGNVDQNLTATGLSVNGLVVSLLVSGGTVNASYTINVAITTSPSGFLLSWVGALLIKP